MLHGRASAWFAQNRLSDEALGYSLTAGDTAAAVELVARHRHDLIKREQLHDTAVAQPILGEISMLRGNLLLWNGDARQAVDYSPQALELLPA